VTVSDSSTTRPVLVSVAILTYNHERYITQAIESVLMQRTNAPFEVVIGEDASSDRTGAIVEEFARQHPGTLRVLAHEQNVGMHRNFASVLAACRGAYVALLEGDDYWTSPDKLQRQIDFLDSHPSYSMCFHDAAVAYENGRDGAATYARLGRGKPPATCTIEHLLIGNFVPTCSVMFRRGLVPQLPDWVSRLNALDWPLHVLHAQHGPVGFIDEVLAVYRVHGGGVWSGQNRDAQLRDIIRFYDAVERRLASEAALQVVKQRRAKAYLGLAIEDARRDRLVGGCRWLVQAGCSYLASGQPAFGRLASVAALLGGLALRRAASAVLSRVAPQVKA
jgi:glycosyltransferase involved in cell wall biosynthesis